MNRFKKITLATAVIAIIASCSMSTKMDATLERDAEATSQLKEVAKVPGKVVPEDVIRVKNDIWLGDTSEIEFEGQPLPAYLEKADGVTLISNRPVTLYEVGDMINKTTSLKVRFGPEMEEGVKKDADEGKPDPEKDDPDWVQPSKMALSYKGPLSGLLDEISSRFGVWWKYEKREIHFYKYITRTFVLYSLPSKSSLDIKVGGAGEGKSSASLGLSSTAEFDLWKNMQESIKSMVDAKSKLSLDPANGTISLTATPDDIKKVARFINEQNARLSRQVAISVKVLQVTLTDADNYGLNFETIFKDSKTTTTLVSAPGLGDLGVDIPSSLRLGIMPGNWDIDAGIQALSKQGTVSLVTSGTVTTLNNKPAPIQVVRKENYISEITKTNSGGDGDYYDISTETEEIETGFTMDVLPRILEHGRMLLMFNLTLSDLLELEKVYLGGGGEESADSSFIQNPIIEARGFTQEVALTSGESLVLTGYERVDSEATKIGVGSAANSLLGGNAVANKTRSILVIILTPVVLESPLTPESRMKNY